MIKWFLSRKNLVSGPFSTEELKSQLVQKMLKLDSLVWSRLQSDWISIQSWQEQLPEIIKKTGASKSNKLWHLAFKGKSEGPIGRDELIQKLVTHPGLNKVLLWTKGMKTWAPIFEFYDILDEVGVNKREHSRASIDGRIVIKLGETDMIGNLESISQGGLGFSGVENLIPGQDLNIEIMSESLATKIRVTGEIRYCSPSGFVGFKFETINSEAKSAIIEYVKSQCEITEKAA